MPSDLILWAESPEEARLFLQRAGRNAFHITFEKIYVAKRSPKNRSNQYTDGQYYVTDNSNNVIVYEDVIVAPEKITALVQWCTCDIMLSRGNQPIAVVEDTTHIVRMNVYQRIPRLFKATMNNIPAIALQGTRGLNFTKRGDCWGMHRYIRAFASINRLYPNVCVLPLYYITNDPIYSEANAEKTLFDYLHALIQKDDHAASTIRAKIQSEIVQVDKNGFHQHIARHIPSIEVTESEVIVHIGAKPNKKSWKEKGSGQMDPYIGMIAAAKYIYCFNESGQKNKDMVVRFTFIPPDFWWFRDWRTSRSLYKTLAFQIADRVEFNGTSN